MLNAILAAPLVQIGSTTKTKTKQNLKTWPIGLTLGIFFDKNKTFLLRTF